jgi:hypothetical protein
MPRRTKPPHEPTNITRQTVKLHGTVGTPQEVIADILEIDAKTLRKYYRRELDLSSAIATANMAGNLYQKGMGGDTASMIFWMKTRANWRETTDLNHTSSDGSMTPKESGDAVLAALARKHADP